METSTETTYHESVLEVANSQFPEEEYVEGSKYLTAGRERVSHWWPLHGQALYTPAVEGVNSPLPGQAPMAPAGAVSLML